MNGPNWIARALFAALLVALGAGGGYWYASRAARTPQPAAGPPPQEAGAGPVASVRVTPIAKGTIQETLTAYGLVIPAPERVQTFSVPYESQVLKVLVTRGQIVEANTPLLDVAPSPDTQLQLEEAQAERKAAQEQLELVRGRVDLKLATRDDLAQAEQRLNAAELRLKNLERRGSTGPETIRASSDGVITRIDAQEGQIVSAGGVLIETIGETQIDVRLGIESEDVGLVNVGQPVRVSPVNAPAGTSVSGTVREITGEVNPDTRLVEVYVALPSETHFLLNEYVRCQLVVGSGEGLVVPHSAVLPRDGEYVVFTVEDGHATQHTVAVGLETDEQIQVVSPNLKAGDYVVVVGNHELEDGMAIRMAPSS